MAKKSATEQRAQLDAMGLLGKKTAKNISEFMTDMREAAESDTINLDEVANLFRMAAGSLAIVMAHKVRDFANGTQCLEGDEMRDDYALYAMKGVVDGMARVSPLAVFGPDFMAKLADELASDMEAKALRDALDRKPSALSVGEEVHALMRKLVKNAQH